MLSELGEQSLLSLIESDGSRSSTVGFSHELPQSGYRSPKRRRERSAVTIGVFALLCGEQPDLGSQTSTLSVNDAALGGLGTKGCEPCHAGKFNKLASVRTWLTGTNPAFVVSDSAGVGGGVGNGFGSFRFGCGQFSVALVDGCERGSHAGERLSFRHVGVLSEPFVGNSHLRIPN